MKQFAISAILTGALSVSVMASPFSDLPSSHWAYGQITALHKAGIIQGVGGNKFNGDEKISRYEAAVMVHNAIRHLNSIKSSGGKIDPSTMDSVSALMTELAGEMQMLQVRVEENADAISALKAHVMKADRGTNVAVGGQNIKFMGQAMFSLVNGGDDSSYSIASATVNPAAAAGAREGVNEFLADYFMLGIEATIDGKTTFHTKANVYTGGQANTAAGLANGIRFDDYMYIHVRELWSKWDMKIGRQYLPWGHELVGAFGTNPYFVSNSIVDAMYGNMVEGAYFSTVSKSGRLNWGLGIHNGSFGSPLANFSHLYPHTFGTGVVVAPFDTSAGTANGFNQNGDDSFGFIAHVGGTSKSGRLNWDVNYFNNGGDHNNAGTGALATPLAVAGFGEMEFFNLGLDYRLHEDWHFAGEYVDGSAEALVGVGTGIAAATPARLGTGNAGANGVYVVEDDFTTWYLQAVYNLTSRSTLAVRYSEHEMERAGARVAVAGFGGNSANYNDDIDELTFAWTRKISDNGTLILEYSTADYNLIAGQDKSHRTAAGSRIADDFDVVRASYRIDF